MSTTVDASFLDEFQRQILIVDDLMRKAREQQWPIEEASAALVRLSNFKTQVAMLMNDQENFLIEKMQETESVVLDSGETVEKKWSKNRTGWQHKDLAQVVASRIENLAIDMDTGERVMSTSDMITKLLDFVQPSYWRVTALTDVGINADDFCQAGDSKASISIRKAK